jgi:hypothetical protein
LIQLALKKNIVRTVKAIAIDIDDTLNDFSEILAGTEFCHHESYPVRAEVFGRYVEMVKRQTGDDELLLDREFSFVRQRVHGECYERAVARADAVEFMRWLREERWRIVICTQRDLRRVEDVTRRWLEENGIPFDYLFIAVDKLGFCKDWGIEHLVDDHLYSVRFAESYGVSVFYPVMAKHEKEEGGRGARGFRNFEEVRGWIER